MKFTTILTTAILLLSAAADAFPHPVADTTSLTLNPIPHSKRSPAATAPKAATKNKAASRTKTTTKAKSKSIVNKVQSGGVKKKTAATAAGVKGKKKTAASTGAAKSCPMPAKGKGKGGKLGKRTGDACGAPPSQKEQLVNCAPCQGLQKRGRNQREKKAAAQQLTNQVMGGPVTPANPLSVDHLVSVGDCWTCPSNRPDAPAIFNGRQVKEAAEKLVSMNAANDQITPAQGGPWPHDFQNFEGVTTPNAQVNRYITFPLLQGGAVYTGAAGQFDGLYRVTVGVSDTNKPITLDVMRHPTLGERTPDNRNSYIRVASNNGN
ncbi:hypothetical protein P167DRAFT_599619 [Morchella conica CCBAS932]|uniref:Uncharacterized protein n=1 Tax=Morchella conica CCBAS932 TaxID=1392247 RepID=A0A3N4K979_9PEZI|nr:hypothetical protein P167DRAFT_599619 [Morchella conica CCBAS932]